eukprot:5788800-Amphidinium_carterae.1
MCEEHRSCAEAQRTCTSGLEEQQEDDCHVQVVFDNVKSGNCTTASNHANSLYDVIYDRRVEVLHSLLTPGGMPILARKAWWGYGKSLPQDWLAEASATGLLDAGAQAQLPSCTGAWWHNATLEQRFML